MQPLDVPARPVGPYLAGNADIDAMADYLASSVVECTVGRPTVRERQLELLANHFALTDMDVLVRDDAYVIRVEFPARQRVH